jgi:hypothetical protein
MRLCQKKTRNYKTKYEEIKQQLVEEGNSATFEDVF